MLVQIHFLHIFQSAEVHLFGALFQSLVHALAIMMILSFEWRNALRFGICVSCCDASFNSITGLVMIRACLGLAIRVIGLGSC